MKEIFIKKFWKEEGVMFYIHFQGEWAVRQIEIFSSKGYTTSVLKPINEESMLYDQKFSDLDLDPSDFISKEQFEKNWKLYDSLD